MKDGMYHTSIRIPAEATEQLQAQPVDVVLNYTYHAITAAQTDRNGKVTLPETINWKLAQLVEIEVVNGKVYKAVARLRLEDR